MFSTVNKPDVSQVAGDLSSGTGSNASSILDAILASLKQLTTDYRHNVSVIVRLAGEYLEAEYAFFARFSNDILQNTGVWQAPDNPKLSQAFDNALCYSILSHSKEDFCYLSEPGFSSFDSCHNPILKSCSFLGYRIMHEGQFRGMLCVFTKKGCQPSLEARKIMEFIASLLGMEEARYRVSESYQASESKYKRLYTMLRLICDNEPDMIWAKDTEGRYIFANKAMCSKLLEAVDTDEPIGKTDHFFTERSCRLHAGKEPWCNNADKCRETDIRTVEADSALQFEEIYHVGGQLRTLDVHKAPLYNDDGVIIGTVGSARDVSEARAVEKALQESQARYSALLEANPDVLFLFNSQGDIIACKTPDNSLLLSSPDAMIGKNMGDYVSEELFDLAMEAINQVRLTGQPYSYEFELQVGNARYFESRFVRCDADLYLNIVRDITDKKEIEKELIRAKEEAEHVNRLKSTFMANMSHELRTPMNGILGFSEILLSMLDNAETKEMARTIHSSGKRLLKTLNLILDLSRIEANKQDIKLKPVELNGFLQKLTKLFEPLAARKELSLSFVSSNQDMYLLTDSSLLEHVVNDLINNAIKFTPHGSVTILLELNPQDETNCVNIKVIDTGIGIPKHKQRFIFDAFRQASEGYERSYEGTGLGLTISRQYVELLGGRLTLHSEPGLGSEFGVIFPKIYLQLPPPSADETESTSANVDAEITPVQAMLPRILLIDDDKISHKLTRKMLEGMAELDFALSGEEGLEMLKNTKYQVVLLDINLGSGMNGLTAIKEIRQLPAYAYTPVIAITAYSMVGDKDKFLSEGFSHYLSKPFSQNDIKQLIAGILD